MKRPTVQIQILALAALLALFSGCDSAENVVAAQSRHTPTVGEKVYRNTCSICHRLGQRGAPRLGDTKDWTSRLAQGNESLYRRAINGYRGSKGSMPSRGSNARLSDDEVKAAVDYMVRYSVPGTQNMFGDASVFRRPQTIYNPLTER